MGELCGTNVHRPGQTTSFFGKTRDAFISLYMDRTLQDDPRVWRLDDASIATIGLSPFADQLRVLGRVLARQSTMAGKTKTKPRKRRRLLNLLSSAEGPNESSSEQ